MSAQLEHEKDQLNDTFEKNMNALQSINTTLYEKMSSMRPKQFRLVLPESGQYNIAQGAKHLYAEDPATISSTQVKEFQREPNVIKAGFSSNSPYTPETYETLNQLHMGLLLSLYQNAPAALPENADHMPFLLVAGVGLGYHLPELCASSRNIVIYEREPEIFFLSLFVTDYAALIEQMTQPMRSIIFAIEKTPEQLLQAIYDRYHMKKCYLLANTYVFSHYTNKAMNADLARIQQLWHRVYTTSGFAEDEFHSLTHFLASETYHEKVIPVRSENALNTPVLILGSGPSLNAQIDTIKKIQDKVIIFSCSSSIDICYRNNITPDFHVEMERHYMTSHALEAYEDKTFLKKITLLCLHTVPPKLHKLFKTSLIAFKRNDITLSLLNDISKGHIEGHVYCYPTAGNAGLSFATSLGFETIYTAGLDFAFEDQNSHHAKDTNYYGEEAFYPIERMEHQLTVEGWDGRPIGTSIILDNSRVNAEYLAHQNPSCQFYNLSRGAKIHGFNHDLVIEDLENLQYIEEKNAIYHQVIQNCHAFESVGLDSTTTYKNLRRRWNHHLQKSKSIVRSFTQFFNLPQSRKELMLDWLDLVNVQLREQLQDNPIQAQLIGGTISTLQILTAAILLEIQEGASLEHKMAFIIQVWQRHLEDCIKLMQLNLDKHSDQMSIERFIPATQALIQKYSTSEKVIQ